MKDEIENHQYNFRRDLRLQLRNVNTAPKELEAQTWNIVSKNLKCSKSFNEFKRNI